MLRVFAGIAFLCGGLLIIAMITMEGFPVGKTWDNTLYIICGGVVCVFVVAFAVAAWCCWLLSLLTLLPASVVCFRWLVVAVVETDSDQGD